MLKTTQIPRIPQNVDPGLRKFLEAVKRNVLAIQSSVLPPETVTSLTATAKAGGVIIEFTRSDADKYTLLRNTTKTMDGAVQFDLGNSNRFVDDIGASAITAYYWVRGKKGVIEGLTAGPVTATTLALDTEITPSASPPGSKYPARNTETNQVEPGRPSGTDYKKV